jgi:FkbM family methyltransferase
MSYSQVGEDLQIAYYLGRGEGVHYIDVGCLWPIQHSNSYYFYERGGRGLCLDANPEVADEFAAKRPRDVFLNRAIGLERASLTYYMHENPVFNTLSDERAERSRRKSRTRPGRRRVREISVPVTTLDEAVAASNAVEILDGRLDFLSVDVEGLEEEVLQSFGFNLLRPTLVVVEHLRTSPEAPDGSAIARLLRSRGYWIAGYSGHDLYFLDENRA